MALKDLAYGADIVSAVPADSVFVVPLNVVAIAVCETTLSCCELRGLEMWPAVSDQDAVLVAVSCASCARHTSLQVYLADVRRI
jgi:hypothetical protein